MSARPVSKKSPAMRACAVPPQSHLKKEADGGPKNYAVMSKKAWELKDLVEGKKFITYGFMATLGGYSDARRDAVRYTIDKDFKPDEGRDFETWEDHANIKFSYQNHTVESCDVRIAFQAGSSWSAVGECAKDISPDRPTLNLGWLKNKDVPSKEDRGTILHEFGHVLGLMHEHQSPARGQFIHLKELEVYRYYEPLLGSRALVKSQIIDTYNQGKIMNMSQFDMQSVMMYFMPARLNEEGIDVPVNTELSKLDKAFITVNYPPVMPLVNEGKPVSEDQLRFMQAMFDAGVTNRAAGEILQGYMNPEPGNASPTLATRLKNVREKFTEYNNRTGGLRTANAALINAVDTGSSAQFGIGDIFGSVLRNPFFKSLLKNVVSNVLVQQGVKLQHSIAGASPSEIAQVMGALVTHPDLAGYVKVLTSGGEDEGSGNMNAVSPLIPN